VRSRRHAGRCALASQRREWQYWIKGSGTDKTLQTTARTLVTMDFNAGDVGYIKKNHSDTIQRPMHTDLQFLEVFSAPYLGRRLLRIGSPARHGRWGRSTNVSKGYHRKIPDNTPGNHAAVSESWAGRLPKNLLGGARAWPLQPRALIESNGPRDL